MNSRWCWILVALWPIRSGHTDYETAARKVTSSLVYWHGQFSSSLPVLPSFRLNQVATILARIKTQGQADTSVHHRGGKCYMSRGIFDSYLRDGSEKSAPLLDSSTLPISVGVKAYLKVLGETPSNWEVFWKQLLAGCDEKAAQASPVSGWDISAKQRDALTAGKFAQRLNLLLSCEGKIRWCFNRKIRKENGYWILLQNPKAGWGVGCKNVLRKLNWQ